MTPKSDDLLRKPLYVFDLPSELLVTLQLKDPSLLQVSSQTAKEAVIPATLDDTDAGIETTDSETKVSTTCQLCHSSFPTLKEQRLHVKSDWHNYNLKQKLRGGQPVTEQEFIRLIEELDESISGSEYESSESEEDEGTKETTLSALLKKQAKLGRSDGEDQQDRDSLAKKKKRGSGKPPLIWFSTTLLPSNTSLGIYRALLTNPEQGASDTVEVLRKKQLPPVPAKAPPTDRSNGVPLPSTLTGPSIFMCMVGGGHFAGMVVSLAPKLGKQSTGTEQRQAAVIAHKTFHRYTTRRKQGGAQSANDSAKGAAHSAGSSLRRYNEVALEQDIRGLLAEWRSLIDDAQLLFVRATGSSNRRVLYGPYEGQVLRQNDPRNRAFPFSTRRATQAELMRAFVELTRIKISEVDEAALAAAAAAAEAESAQAIAKSKITATEAKPKPSKEEEEGTLHTSQLQALIRRSKAPALLCYLTSHSLTSNYAFYPPSAQANYHAPTPLHLASSINSPAIVLALVVKAGADPTQLNAEGKPPFDLAGDRATRDAFRVARTELGEDRWSWERGHVPPPLSKAEAEKRDERDKAEAQKAESERRKAEEERLRKQNPVPDTVPKKGGRALGSAPKSAEERREDDARGMTPEMKMRVERERRARAAEERMKRLAGGGR